MENGPQDGKQWGRSLSDPSTESWGESGDQTMQLKDRVFSMAPEWNQAFHPQPHGLQKLCSRPNPEPVKVTLSRKRDFADVIEVRILP